MAIVGWSAFSAAIDRVVVEADAASKAIVSEGAAAIEKASKQNFSGTHKKGKPHVGGDLPNVVTGSLRRSIRHDPVRKVGFGTWGTTVGPTMVYGRRVELGFNGSKGYPFFDPAVKANGDRLREIAEKHWREALTK